MSRVGTMSRAVVAALWLAIAAGCGGASPPTGPFPDVPGLALDGPAAAYTPDTLYEYIDGAAEAYLALDFIELESQGYRENDEVVLVADVYRHRDLACAFGIYAQERAADARVVDVGGEGTVLDGALAFFKGPYYVKILDYRASRDQARELEAFGRALAARLDGESAMPAAFELLPAADRVGRSERFIARDVLGHGFLHSGYLADYRVAGGGTGTVFLLEPERRAEAAEMYDAYLAYAAGRSAEVLEDRQIASFVDPYYRSSGPVRLALLDGVVLGALGADLAWFTDLAAQTRSRLGADPR